MVKVTVVPKVPWEDELKIGRARRPARAVPHEPSREGGSRTSSLMSVKPQSLMKVGAFFIHIHS
jgi:hypothetical protein